VEINNNKYITYISQVIQKIGDGKKYKEIKIFLLNFQPHHIGIKHLNTKLINQYVVNKVFYVVHVGIN
jgi:hypothetical protein